MFIDSIKKALIGDTVFKSDIDAQYQANPSFSRLLPWGEWSDKHNLFLHKDGFTPCSGLEVSAIACESMGEDVIHELHANIAKLLASVVPTHDEAPWCMQVYVQDTYSLDSLYNKLVDYIEKRNSLDDALVQEYLSVQKNHFKLMCKDEGLFIDPSNNLPFRGRIRRTRVMLYRKVPNATLEMRASLIKTHKRVVKSVISNLRQSGLSVREMQGRHFYDWWVRWFNPRPNICDGDIDKVLERFAYKKDSKKSHKPYGWSFDKNIFFGEVKSYNEEGWIFSSYADFWCLSGRTK